MNLQINAQQSVADAALMKCGTVEASWDIADASGVAIDAQGEQELPIPDLADIDTIVTASIAGRAIASALTGSDYGGVGAMGVEIDFVVK